MKEGMKMAMRMPRITITTRSSMRLKPRSSFERSHGRERSKAKRWCDVRTLRCDEYRSNPPWRFPGGRAV
jgi:hypothetical protein